MLRLLKTARILSLALLVLLVIIFATSFLYGVELDWHEWSFVSGSTGFSIWHMPMRLDTEFQIGRTHLLSWMYYFSPPTVHRLGHSWQFSVSWSFLIGLFLLVAALSHRPLKKTVRKAGL